MINGARLPGSNNTTQVHTTPFLPHTQQPVLYSTGHRLLVPLPTTSSALQQTLWVHSELKHFSFHFSKYCIPYKIHTVACSHNWRQVPVPLSTTFHYYLFATTSTAVYSHWVASPSPHHFFLPTTYPSLCWHQVARSSPHYLFLATTSDTGLAVPFSSAITSISLLALGCQVLFPLHLLNRKNL